VQGHGCLAVADSKGLEFNSVIILNFFGSSPCQVRAAERVPLLLLLLLPLLLLLLLLLAISRFLTAMRALCLQREWKRYLLDEDLPSEEEREMEFEAELKLLFVAVPTRERFGVVRITH